MVVLPKQTSPYNFASGFLVRTEQYLNICLLDENMRDRVRNRELVSKYMFLILIMLVSDTHLDQYFEFVKDMLLQEIMYNWTSQVKNIL